MTTPDYPALGSDPSVWQEWYAKLTPAQIAREAALAQFQTLIRMHEDLKRDLSVSPDALLRSADAVASSLRVMIAERRTEQAAKIDAIGTPAPQPVDMREVA